MKFYRRPLLDLRPRHSPHGECGLKSDRGNPNFFTLFSHSPHGECGLKSVSGCATKTLTPCHSPHGECGLK